MDQSRNDHEDPEHDGARQSCPQLDWDEVLRIYNAKCLGSSETNLPISDQWDKAAKLITEVVRREECSQRMLTVGGYTSWTGHYICSFEPQ